MTLGNDFQAQVDSALQEWNQGDCVIDADWFVYRFNPQFPLTDEARSVMENDLDSDIDLVESEVLGFAVITQTCDIVRSCAARPFVEVAPLIHVEQDKLFEIERCRRPQYAFIPALSEQCLVADLDRLMTLEKALLFGWQRIAGCSNDEETRVLLQALARKRNRFAFPDDFTELAKKLCKRLQSKHSKSANDGKGEGEALRALKEIRVVAQPSWRDTQIEITFWFIRNTGDDVFQGKEWSAWLEKWLLLIPPSGHFRSVDGIVTTLEDLTAKEYLNSYPLDLDNLSTSDSSQSIVG